MEYMVNNMENMHTDVRLKVLTICFVSIGDKKRRDVVQCIVQVPKYDFYIIASQKGIICQWSSKVFINTPSLLIFLWFFPIQCYSVSKRKTVFNVSVMPNFTHAFDLSAEAFYSLSMPTLKGLLSDWLTLICSPIQPLHISKFHGNCEKFVLVSYENFVLITKTAISTW